MNLNLFVIQTLALLITAFLMPRFQVKGPLSAAIAVLVISIVNSTVWDSGLFFTLPDSATTQAAMLIVVNGVLFWLLAKTLPGIEMQGFLPALFAPIVFTIVSGVVYQYGKDVDWLQMGKEGIAAIQDIRDNVKEGTQHGTEPVATPKADPFRSL